MASSNTVNQVQAFRRLRLMALRSERRMVSVSTLPPSTAEVRSWVLQGETGKAGCQAAEAGAANIEVLVGPEYDPAGVCA